jgi:hypothetical protein
LTFLDDEAEADKADEAGTKASILPKSYVIFSKVESVVPATLEVLRDENKILPV